MIYTTIMACLAAVSADTIMPPTTGKFFYSDFMLNENVGYHTLSISTTNMAQSFFVGVSTMDFMLGLYSSDCTTCIPS